MGYEIELSSVDFQGSTIPAHGGMRMTFIPHGGEQPLPELHAGDRIAVIAQARLPKTFRDEGAFDRRAYLAQQGIDLTANLRSSQLVEREGASRPTINTLLAKLRRRFREELTVLFRDRPQVAAVLRAMLLGDRNFVDQSESVDFQKTGAFHVLAVAGLHVGALALLLYWLARRLRFSAGWTVLFVLTFLFVYVGVVEERPPVLRAALMAALFVGGGFFYRRLELLNSGALAALLLLTWRPLSLTDSSFQLSFLAIGCIAGLAVPSLAETLEPYARALRGWRDVTRDAAFEPRAIQFRIDLRSAAAWFSAHVPRRVSGVAGDALAGSASFSFRAWELLVLTLVLQLGMLPLMARDFHRITLAAPLVNLLVVPLTGLIVPLGFLALGAGLLVSSVGRLLAVPLGWLTLLLLRVVTWFAHFPSWSYRIPTPYGGLVAFFFVLLLALCVTFYLESAYRKTAALALATALAISAATVAVFPFSPKWSKGKLELTVLDVRQGDSLFVVSPGGKTLLIDGGGDVLDYPGHEVTRGFDPGEEAVSPYLWSRGFKKLDVVALTHAHRDHLGGLAAVLNNFRVDHLWIGREVSIPALSELEDLARSHGVSVEHEAEGSSFSWDGVIGTFFWPEASSTSLASAAKNNDSLVLRLQYGKRTMLLPGDAERETERAVLAHEEASALRADVLKIGHHGSKNSTTQPFLDAIEPKIAIISSGEDNPYGHPSPELLDRLQTVGARIYRTDRNGAIRVLTDGQTLEVSCFVDCGHQTN
jgi:competence protein ComEC